MKILVTAGGTKEYIDGVRYIGNCSSGQTGAELVDHLASLGHEVTWLGAKTAVRPNKNVTQLIYETFDELSSAMQKSLANSHFDVVFQAAAVSDFKVSSVRLDGIHFTAGRGVKLPTADEVQLQLTKQPKLVSSVKSWSNNSAVKVVAFKLTNSSDDAVKKAAIAKLLKQSAVDFVAHNDLNEISDSTHGFCLYSHLEDSVSCDNVQAMADTVLGFIGGAA
ncbi:phosphopantothenoylcysteine decarboxylase [Marinicella litoralis]|uniref:DNA/pantothenate metabolism flavoprotein n=1 Tax=Marinicella litoralis TaxID=644220 RepID=A0A4R6XWI7_9GAMM|nr:phosphopantothenoylcysteine decarboxylase [Marinicella litoralis]TDR20858.1 DNA/pantothenate metabolism flavoprotein [Marinicella litoralis]